jgi:hypothetical protein
MGFKSSVLGILAAAVIPTAALADHNRVVTPLNGSIDVRIGTPPQGAPSAQGRYERRIVSRWVPGYSEQIWVDGVCYEKHGHHGRGRGRGHGHGHHKVRCTEGHYETRWIPGHSVDEEQWVWVAYPPPPSRPGVQIRLSSMF